MSHDPIAVALDEDIGQGDLTSQYFVPGELIGSARIFAKEPGIAAGVDTAAEVFQRVDPTLSVQIVTPAGQAVGTGQTVLVVSGPVRSILTAERVALNFLQRLSATATLTRRFVDAVAGTSAVILDTRKTTPGLRMLEKEAVRAGGGQNHRFGLYDMVMVKDNHLAADSSTFAKSLRSQIAIFRREHPGVKVEVEADTLDQVRAFLEIPGIDVILLDNMTPAQMREAVQLRGAAPIKLEASGGVTLAGVRDIAVTGVDFISVGALTHSAGSLDFSLELLSSADHLDADEIVSRLPESRWIRRILVFEKTGSTNDLIGSLAREGEAPGIAAFAEEQTAGRGRLGRRWESDSRAGLWFSLLLRPELPYAQWPRLTLWIAYAVAQGVRQFAGVELMLKWPNDLFISGRKVAGILVESSLGKNAYAAAGIGVNVNHPCFPAPLDATATSLRIQTGTPLNRIALAAAILRSIDQSLPLVVSDFQQIIAWASKADYLRGRWVSASCGTDIHEGEAQGLDSEGALLIRTAGGAEIRLNSGEVTRFSVGAR